MGRIVVVTKRHDQLTRLIMEKSYDAIAVTNFNFEIQSGDVICWLPQVNEPVDEEVQELAEMIDRSIFLPRKIVMLSIAGTADDANEDQLKRWYGKQALQAVLAYQYAIKMIDEFEIPYTIIRTLPIGSSAAAVRLVDEGQSMVGKKVGERQVAQTVLQVLTSSEFDNHSIGIVPITK